MERYQDDASVLKWREMPSMAAARAYGPIELAAASYTGEHADCLGAYELQEEMVEGRPTYRQKTGRHTARRPGCGGTSSTPRTATG